MSTIYKYKLIIFDIDDTLFDYEKTEEYALKNTFLFFNLSYNCTYYSIYRTLNRSLWENRKTVCNDIKQFKIFRFKKFLAEIGLVFSAELFSNKYNEYSQEGCLIDGVEEVVEILYKKIYLVAATNGPIFPRLQKIENSSLRKKVKFYSAEKMPDGVEKPDPRFFHEILKDYPTVPMEKILIVGDKLSTDICGAASCGIDSVLFLYREKDVEKAKEKPTYIIKNFRDLLSIVVGDKA